jgi:hypothetical protein
VKQGSKLGMYVEGVGLLIRIYYPEKERIAGRWKKVA